MGSGTDNDREDSVERERRLSDLAHECFVEGQKLKAKIAQLEATNKRYNEALNEAYNSFKFIRDAYDMLHDQRSLETAPMLWPEPEIKEDAIKMIVILEALADTKEDKKS